MRIFITGCAKSGTTLLARLFSYFENVYVHPKEINVFNSKELKAKEKHIISKRNQKTIFSQTLYDYEMGEQLYFIKKNNIKVINVVRDGRDVLPSLLNEAKYDRWIDAIDQSIKYSRYIDYQIKYEDLVNRPDEVQKELELKYGLKPLRKFSQYPEQIDKQLFKEVKRDGNKYSLRPIDKKSLKKNLWFYKSVLNPNQVRQMDWLLKKLNYL